MQHGESILIFGSERSVTPRGPVDTLASGRVGVEMLKANMTAAMRSVAGMAEAAQEALDGIKVVHLDVELAVGIDGSVGLLGSGVSSSVKGTVTVRVEPRATELDGSTETAP